jgi:epoxyqueuosine reductase
MGFLMDLKQQLEKIARRKGADYFGIADFRPLAKGAVTTPYEADLLAHYPFAVSIGVALVGDIVDSIGNTSDYFATKNYWYHVYETINPRINDITLDVGRALMNAGHNALIIPSSQTLDTGKLTGLFSHKMAASQSGLGWIGKSCLLITPDRGPRVRWGTILTDAPLQAGAPLGGPGCGSCRKCVEICPVGAFTGKDWKASEGRETRMDARKCFDYLRLTRKEQTGVEACGMCVYICPFGAAKKKRAALKKA